MLNPSDKRLEHAIREALKTEIAPSSELKAEIWQGLIAKLDTLPDQQVEPVWCLPTEQPSLIRRLADFMMVTLGQSGVFLFSDEIPFERARQNTIPHTHYWLRWQGSFAVA